MLIELRRIESCYSNVTNNKIKNKSKFEGVLFLERESNKIYQKKSVSVTGNEIKVTGNGTTRQWETELDVFCFALKH